MAVLPLLSHHFPGAEPVPAASQSSHATVPAERGNFSCHGSRFLVCSWYSFPTDPTLTNVALPWHKRQRVGSQSIPPTVSGGHPHGPGRTRLAGGAGHPAGRHTGSRAARGLHRAARGWRGAAAPTASIRSPISGSAGAVTLRGPPGYLRRRRDRATVARTARVTGCSTGDHHRPCANRARHLWHRRGMQPTDPNPSIVRQRAHRLFALTHARSPPTLAPMLVRA